MITTNTTRTAAQRVIRMRRLTMLARGVQEREQYSTASGLADHLEHEGADAITAEVIAESVWEGDSQS